MLLKRVWKEQAERSISRKKERGLWLATPTAVDSSPLCQEARRAMICTPTLVETQLFSEKSGPATNCTL